jgi:hypothetical protein
MLEYGISFKLKMPGFQEMHLRTIENAKALEEAQKREMAQIRAQTVQKSGALPILTDTSKAYNKS